MIFLKKFEAYGFKSFADYTKINIDSTLIGIVGPNGSGKSNVIDAIKWVLGEQSIKSLRGKKSDDIIFHGSKTKIACNYAMVTLTFDNKKRNLLIDSDEVSVTRKLYRGNGSNEYYVNNEISRLKDIHDIFSNTGLSKGSLGIISQGTVNWFADSKPEERRKIFEEAAAISKYTRKKEESLRQLERTQINLNRVSDITKELYKDIKKLEVQAEKAKEYTNKKEELTNLEVSILVKDIISAQKQLDEISQKLIDCNNLKNDLSPKLDSNLKQLSQYKTELEKVEFRLEKFNWEQLNINEKINKLSIEKTVFENDIAIDLNSSDFDSKVKALESKILTESNDLNANQNILETNKNELNKFNNLLNDLTQEQKTISKITIDLNNQITAKEYELKSILEYIRSKPDFLLGPKTIINNKTALTGILGTVLDFFDCDEQYQKPLMIALGKNAQNIIVNTNRDAKRGIDFLVENKAGTATFMPIYEMKVKPMKSEHLDILQQLSGFVGIASDLVSVEKKVKPVFEILLNRIIIASDFNSALEISKFTFQLYKIITLDGQIINPLGVITGGYISKNPLNSLVNSQKKINEIDFLIKDLKDQLNKKNDRNKEIELIMIDLQSKITERKANIAIYSKFNLDLNQQIILYKSEYQKLTRKNFDLKENTNNSIEDQKKDLIERLNKLKVTKQKIINEISEAENSKKIIKKTIIELETEIEEMRQNINTSVDVIVKLSTKEVENKKILEYSKQKLNDTYKLTIESAIEKYNKPLDMTDDKAKLKIQKLSKEISYIGNINMDAANELKEKSERYEKMKSEETEISNAKDSILNIISDLDQKAHQDFENTIVKINEELPNTFRYLFGGGDCSIEFTDPSDILTSGIDIKASPPGKHINSLFALSGGEKTLVALSVLFSILKTSNFPLVVLDEAESALDPSNVERFGEIISAYSNETQFIVITHRPGTMERCDKLFGATMQQQGVTSMFQVKVQEAKKIVESE